MARIGVDRRTAVVTMTHDPKIDDPALAAALRTDAFYVGALGSRKTQAARRERLRGQGFSEARRLADRRAGGAVHRIGLARGDRGLDPGPDGGPAPRAARATGRARPVSGDLYHDALVALAREATGAGRLAAPAASATRDNPLCGDRVTFDVQVAGGRVVALAHRVRGCILCQASAAFLGKHAPGHGRAELAEARGRLAALLRRRDARFRRAPGPGSRYSSRSGR